MRLLLGADCCGREQEVLYYYSKIQVVYIVIIWCAQTMFVLVWSQVQHGNGLINHMMIAIQSISSLLASALPVDPITGYHW